MYIRWIVESPREASTRCEAMAEAKLPLSHCNISEHTDVKIEIRRNTLRLTQERIIYISLPLAQ